MKNYYEILNIAKNASEKEIKEAYKKLAIKYHPDKSKAPNAEQKFKEVSEAFDVLGNPKKRKHYDQFGTTKQGPVANGDPFDIFRSIFGGSNPFSGRKQVSRGPNINIESLEIDFFEAYTGTKKTITYKRPQKCPTCKASGVKPGAKKEICTHCGGKGVQIQSQGFFTLQQPCRVCSGVGHKFKKEDLCSGCSGAKVKKVETEIEVDIPPGVFDSAVIRIAGKGGDSLNSGPPGDLFIKIKIKGNPLLERVGLDVYSEVPLSVSEAIEGSKKEILTLDRTIKQIEISAGTQPTSTLLLKGAGFPDVRGGAKGNHIVKFLIEIPAVADPSILRNLRQFEKQNSTKKRRDYAILLNEYSSNA